MLLPLSVACTSSATEVTSIFSIALARWASTVLTLIAERLGDLAVLAAEDDEVHDFALALGEGGEAGFGAAALHALGVRGAAESRRLFDQREELVARERLLQEVESAVLQRIHRHGNVAVAGDEDDGQRCAAPVELVLQLDARSAASTPSSRCRSPAST